MRKARKQAEPKKYVVFGGGHFLSDIFDLIHANGGVVHKIHQNIPEIRAAHYPTLRERVALLQYPVDVRDSVETFVPEEGCAYVIGFLSAHKYFLVEELKAKYSLSFSQLVHPKIDLGSNIHVGEGVIINAGTVIGPNAFLSDFCSVNRATMIGHDVKVGKYTRIGPRVALAGGAHIGEKCSIGMSASVLGHVAVGARTVIGAGALVTNDIPENVVAYGVPARVIRPNDKFSDPPAAAAKELSKGGAALSVDN